MSFKNSNIPENSLHIDWLEFTFLGDFVTFSDLLIEMGVPISSFVDSNHGRYGYNKCMVFQTSFFLMNLEFEQQQRMGFHLCIPASALPYYDISPMNKPKYKDFIRLTRLDLAFDIIGDSIPSYDDEFGDRYVFRVWSQIQRGNYATHVAPKSMSFIQNNEQGATIYIGASKANKRLRIYDKQAETGSDFRWVRFEYQLRHEVANSYIQAIFDNEVMNAAFQNLFTTFFVLTTRGTTNVSSQGQVIPCWDDVYKLLGKVKAFFPMRYQTSTATHPFYKKLQWLIKQCAPTFCFFAEYYDDWDFLDYRQCLARFFHNYKEFTHYHQSGDGKLMYDDFEIITDDFNFDRLL